MPPLFISSSADDRVSKAESHAGGRNDFPKCCRTSDDLSRMLVTSFDTGGLAD